MQNKNHINVNNDTIIISVHIPVSQWAKASNSNTDFNNSRRMMRLLSDDEYTCQMDIETSEV